MVGATMTWRQQFSSENAIGPTRRVPRSHGRIGAIIGRRLAAMFGVACVSALTPIRTEAAAMWDWDYFASASLCIADSCDFASTGLIGLPTPDLAKVPLTRSNSFGSGIVDGG
jgi:hypothetical protein